MKKTGIVICILITLILLIPLPAKMKDGGTVHYNAILYDIYDVHRVKPADVPNEDGTYETEYIEGIVVEIFGVEVFNKTVPRAEH